jgi:hypothetical protein
VPLRIAVVADDLTSAGDGAASFRAAGHSARVVSSAPVRQGYAKSLYRKLGVATRTDVVVRRGHELGLI